MYVKHTKVHIKVSKPHNFSISEKNPCYITMFRNFEHSELKYGPQTDKYKYKKKLDRGHIISEA